MSDDLIQGLLEAWRRTRHPEFADALARASRALESPEATAIRERKVPQAEWLEGAATATPVDRDAWASTLGSATSKQVKARVLALVEWGDDPREVDALHALVESVPWVSTGSRPTWTQVFTRLKALKDPRTRAVAAAFDPASLGSTWGGPAEYFARQLARVATALERIVVLEPTEAEWALIAEAAQFPGADSGADDEPLEAVFADPSNLEVRWVIADALQERGDPRGELIALQHAVSEGAGDRKTAARIKRICKDHRDALLGPLRPILKVTTVEFRLGFLHACEVKEVVHDGQVDEAMKSPLARTIHTLSGPASVLVRPELIGLRKARMRTFPTEGARLLGLDRQTAIEDLTLPVSTPEDRQAFQTTVALPALESLTLTAVEPEDRKALCEAPLARQVRKLCFEERIGSFVLPSLTSLVPLDSSVEVLRLFHDDVYSRWYGEVRLERDSANQQWQRALLDVGLPTQRWAEQRFWPWVDAMLAAISETIPLTVVVRVATAKQREELARRTEGRELVSGP